MLHLTYYFSDSTYPFTLDDERILAKLLINLYMFDHNSFVKVVPNFICMRIKALSLRKNKGQMSFPSLSHRTKSSTPSMSSHLCLVLRITS